MKNIVKNLKKYKYYLFYILFLLIILIIHFYSYSIKTTSDYVHKHFSSSYFEKENVEYYPYYQGTILQKFKAQENGLYKVKIYLNGIENYQTSNGVYEDAYFIVSIEDENHNTIEQHRHDKVFFEIDGSFSFEFKTQDDSIGKEYYLKIEVYHITNLYYLAIENNSIIGNYNDNQLLIDNKSMEGHLIFSSVYKTDNSNNNILFLVLTCIITIMFTFIFIILMKKKLPIEKQYLVISIIVSLLMIFLSSPLSGNDEMAHYARIYELGSGNLVTDKIDGWLYTEVPNVDIGYRQYNEIPNLLTLKDNTSSIVEMQYTSVYSPLSYIPQVIGLKIAQLFCPNSFYVTYFIRLFEALSCIVFTYFAIKIIPFGKKVVFFIALLPTYIQATCFISADALLVSSSLLLIAKTLQLANSKDTIKKTDYLLLFILSSILALSKLVYIPLCFVLLYLVYKRKETKVPIISILATTCILVLLWNIIAMNNLTSGQGGNAIYYIKQILTNPLSFIQITLYSFVNQIGNHISDLFGGANAWQDNVIFDSSIFPVLFFAIYIYILEEDKFELENNVKRFLSLIILATFLLISMSLYISCTPINHKQIVGIQGRYLLPLLLPIYLLFPKMKKNEKVNLSVLLTLIYLAYFLRHILVYL